RASLRDARHGALRRAGDRAGVVRPLQQRRRRGSADRRPRARAGDFRVNELRDLYREVILDHNRSPRNFGEIEGADRVVEGVNPLCGDRLTLYVKLDDGRIGDIKFKGSGCAISMASSSLMTERVKGATVEESMS